MQAASPEQLGSYQWFRRFDDFDGLVKRIGNDDGLVLLHAALFSTRQAQMVLASEIGRASCRERV